MNQSTIDALMLLSDFSNQYQATTISKLVRRSKYGYTKIYNDIQCLSEAGLVEEGIKIGNAKSYYITQQGIELLRKIKDLSSKTE